MEVRQEFTGSSVATSSMTCMVATLVKNVLTIFDDDAESFFLNFLMYVQIATTDIYMATQNWIQNTASLQN